MLARSAVLGFRSGVNRTFRIVQARTFFCLARAILTGQTKISGKISHCLKQ
jgi:hypothetical protein